MDRKQNKHGQQILRLHIESEGEPKTHYDRIRAMCALHAHPYHGVMMESVFQKVESAQAQGISFGEGEFYMNRTLDIFYNTQLYFISRRHGLRTNNFESFYTQHRELLDEHAWQRYYSRSFLLHHSTHRFWRLPDLQDLPDSNEQAGIRPREKGPGHHVRLPYWANNVRETHARQETLPTAKTKEIALRTLEQTILRQQDESAPVEPYSETQAQFWLDHYRLGQTRHFPRGYHANTLYYISDGIRAGRIDVLYWQKSYSAQRWHSMEGRTSYLPPDKDGSDYQHLKPDGEMMGGVGYAELLRGWEPEVGSAEEVEFLAAVAIEELSASDLDALRYSHRSHMLLGVFRTAELEAVRQSDPASDPGQQPDAVTALTDNFFEAGRFENRAAAENWIKHTLEIMRPYVQQWIAARDPSQQSTRQECLSVLQHILLENGQVFGRYKTAHQHGNFGPSVFALESKSLTKKML